MGIIVQKFGGTSVADTDKIKNVASAVIKEKNNGNDVIVVVSAMGHTTDYLVKMANEITSKPNSRELDMLLATGEQVSIALLTMAIQAQGYAAVSMNAMQVGIITECVHSKARIVDIKTNKLKEHLNKGEIVVVAGLASGKFHGHLPFACRYHPLQSLQVGVYFIDCRFRFRCVGPCNDSGYLVILASVQTYLQDGKKHDRKQPYVKSCLFHGS